MKRGVKTVRVATVLGMGLSGCVSPRHTRFVDVPPPIQGAKVAVLDASEEVVRLQVAGPQEPVFLALVEPRVIDDSLYLFPSYISKPTVSERLEVPVAALDLPTDWRERIFWVEGDHAPRWFQIFRERVRTIERRHLEPPAE